MSVGSRASGPGETATEATASRAGDRVAMRAAALAAGLIVPVAGLLLLIAAPSSM